MSNKIAEPKIDERFLNVGFEKVGQWRFLQDQQLDFQLDQMGNDAHVIYSFVSNSQILYIGKTSRKLKERMAGYKNPGPSQKTNKRNNANIRRLLEGGESVDIFAYSHDEDIFFRGIVIDVADAIEAPLIAMLKPKWNLMGNHLERSEIEGEELVIDSGILRESVKTASYKSFELSKDANNRITVYNSGVKEKNAMKALRMIAAEIGIPEKNANGKDKNTQNLGAQIIKHISRANAAAR